MAEFGQTGKWQIVPVRLVMAFISLYLLYSVVGLVKQLFRSRIPLEFMPNDIVSVLASMPTSIELDSCPELIEYAPLPWLYELHKNGYIIRALGGILGALSFIAPFRPLTYALYVLSIIYSVNFLITHIGVLYAFRNNYVLESIPSRAKQLSEHTFLLGKVKWPELFWYRFAYKSLFNIYSIYSICDLYYSYYLILCVGGSGWENLPANQLPGWEKYIDEKERLKLSGKTDIHNMNSEDITTLLQKALTDDELKKLLNQVSLKYNNANTL